MTYRFPVPLAVAAALYGLSLPTQASDLLLFNMGKQQQSHSPIKVSDHKGYNNQPAFSHDSQYLLFSSNRSMEQMDIYRHKLGETGLTNLTNTPTENEFSPQSPKAGMITYVVQEGVPHQSVWQKNLGEPRRRGINSMIPAGYYAQKTEVGTLIWARYGYNLYFEPQGDAADERHFVQANVGRSLHVIPNRNQFSFVHKQVDGTWAIKAFDPAEKTMKSLIAINPISEDYTWHPNGSIFAGRGSELVRWQPGEKDWSVVADLAPFGVNNIGRLAISPDGKHLALVDKN